MLIPLAVMSLPWVTLGQVSKTLLINKTYLTHEQLEATRWLFCQFDRREDRHPLPLKLQGGRWWDTQSQMLRETRGPALGP